MAFWLNRSLRGDSDSEQFLRPMPDQREIYFPHIIKCLQTFLSSSNSQGTEYRLNSSHDTNSMVQHINDVLKELQEPMGVFPAWMAMYRLLRSQLAPESFRPVPKGLKRAARSDCKKFKKIFRLFEDNLGRTPTAAIPFRHILGIVPDSTGYEAALREFEDATSFIISQLDLSRMGGSGAAAKTLHNSMLKLMSWQPDVLATWKFVKVHHVVLTDESDDHSVLGRTAENVSILGAVNWPLESSLHAIGYAILNACNIKHYQPEHVHMFVERAKDKYPAHAEYISHDRHCTSWEGIHRNETLGTRVQYKENADKRDLCTEQQLVLVHRKKDYSLVVLTGIEQEKDLGMLVDIPAKHTWVDSLEKEYGTRDLRCFLFRPEDDAIGNLYMPMTTPFRIRGCNARVYIHRTTTLSMASTATEVLPEHDQQLEDHSVLTSVSSLSQ